MDVLVVARQIMSDTGQIEARNAAIRRAVHTYSVHTHQMHIEAASADFVIRHCQKHETAVPPDSSATQSNAQDGDGEPAPKASALLVEGLDALSYV